MLRELQVILNKNIDAMYVAGENMVTGMGVIKDFADSNVDLPAAEKATNIFFVNYDPIIIGNAAIYEMSDYDDFYNKIASGERIKLVQPLAGERYATDQYTSTGLENGNAMSVGTDGKWKKATAQLASHFVYSGTMPDNGHTLAIIEVVDDTVTNS